MHISAAPLSDHQSLRIFEFFNRDSLASLRDTIAQRPPNDYCTPCRDAEWAQYSRGQENKLAAARNAHRGATKLFTEHSTHEVRIFRHPTSYLEAAKNLDFVKSAVSYSALDLPITVADYLHWLEIDRYPDLAEFVSQQKINLEAHA